MLWLTPTLTLKILFQRSESSNSSDSSNKYYIENSSNGQIERGKTPIIRGVWTRGGLIAAAINIKVDTLSKDLEFEKKW